jgi:hypothetical protein
MKGCPTEVVGPMGPWWKKFHETVKLVQVGDSCERVVELWGEPDIRTRPNDRQVPEYAAMGMYDAFEAADEMWGYVDYYHTNRLYILEIKKGIVLQKYRSQYRYVEPTQGPEGSQ